MNTFTKLSSGDWGVRIEGPAPAVGSTVTVAKRSGATKNVVVSGIVSTGGGVTVVKIEEGRARAPRRSYGRRSYAAPRGLCEDAPCCGCCGPVPGYGGSWD